MIRLYTYQQCPFCEKVRRAFRTMNVDYEEVNADRGTEGSAQLLKLGGKQQVPFLADDDRGVLMYESDDIIAYAENYLRSN